MVRAVLQLWQRTCTAAGLRADFSTSWWQQVLDHYTEPQRHYHTMTHLEELTALYSELHAAERYHRPDVVAWTLFFHDIIYDPKRGDNEEQSADLWLRFMRDAGIDEGYKDDQLTTTVREYILQTKNHMAVPEGADQDLLLFLDMDIAILGSPRERYATYADQIWREYSHYPRQAFCEGRVKILRNFVSSDRLFKTPELAARFQAQARVNLEWEIVQLECPPMVTEPLYFADRTEASGFESDNRRGDPLRIASEDLAHMLAMNTGRLSVTYRHRESKAIAAMLVASLTESHEGAVNLYRATFENMAGPTAVTADDLKDLARKLNGVDGYNVECRGDLDIHGDHLMIHSVCVQRSLRRRGIATKLLKEYVEMVTRDCPQIRRISTVVPLFMCGCLSRIGFVDCGPRVASELVDGSGVHSGTPSPHSERGRSPVHAFGGSPMGSSTGPSLFGSGVVANADSTTLREMCMVVPPRGGSR
jgi:predicted metal-dependent HD superfamily phosphohydrolase/GNAT superfamily N-acetyltransferase